MALIIEDGSGKTDSNSYATVAELRAYAALRGSSVPTPDADCEVLLVKAMDFLEGQDFVGDRNSRTQALAWPRVYAVVENWPVSATEIPRQLVQAQCALAIEAQTLDLLPTTQANASGPVISEEVAGAVKVAYANPSSPRNVPAVAKASALLSVLLKRSGLVAVRV